MNKQRGDADSRIPRFASYEEEADFWDTHDTTDYDHDDSESDGNR